jgi:hypothetical protein
LTGLGCEVRALVARKWKTEVASAIQQSIRHKG